MYAGIKEHSERGYLGALETDNAKVAELAEIGVDLIHPEGGREPIIGRATLIVLLIELAPIHKFFQTQFFQSVFERSSGSLVSTGQFVVVPNHIW